MTKDLSQFETAPLDFTEFLSRRLNMQPNDVVAMLGDCLVDYEPSRRYEIVVGPEKHAA